jgi:hypothetical protein
VITPPRKAVETQPGQCQAQLEAWLAEWQKALRLQDWQVTVAVRRERAMHSDDCEGCNRYQPALKRASIHVRDVLDDPENADFPADPEATIVHELLHLHFAPFYVNKGLVNVFQEQAIEVIAQSLVGLKRRGMTVAKKKDVKKPPKVKVPAPMPEASMGGKGKGKGGKKGC